MTTNSPVVDRPRPQAKPLLSHQAGRVELITIRAFLIIPFLALVAVVPAAWGWGIGWAEIGVGAAFYVVSGLGVTIGYHRYFTHGAFKANRALRIALAVAGGLAAQGSVITWVADHRRHHAFSDREGDPHSPWLFGTSAAALAKGFWHAHMGWLFGSDRTNVARFAPDLADDPDIRAVDRMFPLLVTLSVGLPAVLVGLITWSWWGLLTGFLWSGLARVAFLHHVTWSVNSVCHMVGDRPFTSRDRSANFWPLAILSFGESWHNLHHADPTSARHGVKRGQIDISARVIWAFEKLGWARDARWSSPERLERLAAKA
ncbi:fatty acid desaturase [Actinokineospora auranticolor]|uniref:Stearoyl-CoA desaturase (Delta-9 desaturase) n=1 Tax=Actinokineospora auranticolor TaxID=155976 RepID=A0A2S6GJ38_9PSEU|nr:fatty acid desaturase [Actinokineospora auranticolor]PPK65244.1 stearoyl-CoA desaturase (delta-9 desaturase) [Actinokineospora auranticolor]